MCYHEQSGEWLIEKIIKNLDPLTFVNLNRGDLLKLFSPGIFKLDQKKQQFIKWCKTYPIFTKFMKCESILREDIKQPFNKKVKLLINVFYAFENFKIYLSNLNIKKNIDFLWELLSINTPWLNPKGLNILIIEKIIEEQKEKIKILCPKNGSPQLLYNSKAPIYMLLKTGDLYEPIIFTLSDKKDKKYEDINKTNLPIDTFEIINDLMVYL